MIRFDGIENLGQMQAALEAQFQLFVKQGGLKKHKHGLYEKAVYLASDMRSHIDFMYRPVEPENHEDKHDPAVLRSWLYRYRPNESKQVRQYRIAIWEAVTASLMAKPLTFLARLFNPKLTRILYPSILPARTSGQEINAYLEGLDFMNWLKDKFLKFNIIDANGFVVVRTDKPDEGLEPNELPEPRLHCIPSTHIVDYDDNFLVTLSTDKSEVILTPAMGSQPARTEFTGLVFFVYTPDITFRLFQTGRKEDKTFSAQIWNAHFLGVPSFIQGGGDLAPTDQQVESLQTKAFYQSFLIASLPHLNELASVHNNQQASFISRIFLEKYQKARGCPECKGTGKVKKVGLYHKEGYQHDVCGVCNGRKFIAANSILDGYSIKGLKATDDLKPPAGYIDIPTDIVEVTEEKLKQLRFQALAAIHMESLEQENKVTSAVGLEKEREGLYALLENIVLNTFPRVGQRCIDLINGIRYGALLSDEMLVENRPILIPPQRFDIRTLGDSIAEYKELSDVSTPRTMRVSSLARIVIQSYGQESNASKSILTELLVDPLAGMSDDELMTANSLSVKPTKLDLFKHYYAATIISQCKIDDPTFLSLPEQDRLDKFNEKAEVMFSDMEEQKKEEAPASVANLAFQAALGSQGGGSSEGGENSGEGSEGDE